MSPRAAFYVLLEDERDLGLVDLAASHGDVTALSCAAASEQTRMDVLLRDAAARGARRLARIADPVLAGVDYLAVAHVLACAVRHLAEASPDTPAVLIAGDRGRGAVGAAVAERLSLPHVGAVRRIGVDGTRVIADRLCGAELRRYSAPAPVVLVCVPPPASPADGVPVEAPIESLSLEALHITAPELQYRRRFRPVLGAGPPSRPHLVSNIEHLGDRLLRDGLWPVPLERTARSED
jgi:hypothetical protein